MVRLLDLVCYTLIFACFAVLWVCSITGDHFGRLLGAAFAKKKKHETVFAEYTATFPVNTVKKWQEDIDHWDTNHASKPDPYEELTTSRCCPRFDVCGV